MYNARIRDLFSNKDTQKARWTITRRFLAIRSAGWSITSYCFALLILLLHPLLIFGEQLPVQIFTSADNLIYDGIRRIYQDSRGLIWFCTPIGVSRFDGYQFTNYGLHEGLINPGIVDIVEDTNGVYWLGSTGSGVYRFDPRPRTGDAQTQGQNSFENHLVSDGPGSNYIQRFHRTAAGEVLVGTNGGMFRLTDDSGEQKFQRVELSTGPGPTESFGVIAFAEDAGGSLWIGHARGLTRRLPDGRMFTY